MSAITLDSRLVPSGDVVSQQLEGELVLLDLERAEYFGLNQTGTRVWKGMAEGLSLRTIADRLADECGIDTDRAGTDVLALAHALLDAGLVSADDGASHP